MKLSTLNGTLGLALVLLGSLPVPAASGQSDRIQLRVSVFNSSPFLPSTVEKAESEAGHVLRDAGVAVIWLNCPQDAQHEASLGPCSEASFPSHLHLRIVRASRGLKATTVGISFVAEDGNGCYADVFYEPIQQLNEETHVPPAVILGHAMAHELGHLLLGTNSHSSSGLMRARWTGEDLAKASKGNFRFSQEQSLRITNRLAQRTPPDLQTLLLQKAVAHEIAHALCPELNENRAAAIGRDLFTGKPASCRATRQVPDTAAKALSHPAGRSDNSERLRITVHPYNYVRVPEKRRGGSSDERAAAGRN